MKTPLRIAICDDAATDRALLEGCLTQSEIAVDCTEFACAEDFLASFYAGRYDVVFMDIYMDDMLGVEVVERIRRQDRHVVIAFTTSSTAHALEGYRLGVLKYLEKPICENDVTDVLRLAILQRDSKETISLLIGGKRMDIPIDDILYFELENHAIWVHTALEVWRTSQTARLDQIEKQLSAHPFLRTHKSFLVNLRHIAGIDREFGDFRMSNGDTARVRVRDRARIHALYEDYLFASARGDAP